MTHPVPVHLQDDLFYALCNATGEGWFGDKTSEALAQAVRNYLAEGHAAAPSTQTPAIGYQWKQLFLPDGTLLRATTHGKTSYAKVEGHAIISDGKPVTPSQLANRQGGVRNAWRVLWLRPPGEDWERADRCGD